MTGIVVARFNRSYYVYDNKWMPSKYVWHFHDKYVCWKYVQKVMWKWMCFI